MYISEVCKDHSPSFTSPRTTLPFREFVSSAISWNLTLYPHKFQTGRIHARKCQSAFRAPNPCVIVPRVGLGFNFSLARRLSVASACYNDRIPSPPSRRPPDIPRRKKTLDTKHDNWVRCNNKYGPLFSAQPIYGAQSMALPRIVPPLDYLREASPASLQSFELARLNHAANLRREIGTLIDQWIQETSEALLARWMLDNRNSIHEPIRPSPDLYQSFLESASAPLPNSQSIPAEFVSAPPRFADSRQPLGRSIERKPQKHRSTA